MVLLYTPKKQAKKAPHFETTILDLDYQGLGVAKQDGKTWFIENALPDEVVLVEPTEEKRQYGLGVAKKILRESPNRQQPNCPYYGQCGGCQGQHIPLTLQRETKQKALFRRLTQLQSQAIELMPMLVGEPWHYRRRVRLSLCYDPKHKSVALGFRQKSGQKIIPVTHCDVADEGINALLPMLHTLCQQWSKPKLLGHIELVAADNGIAMLLRHRETLAEKDRTLLLELAQQQNLMLFVQDDEYIHHIYGNSPYYQLADGICLHFDIRDFIQVNRQLNQQMVSTALDWLDLQPQDNVLDLFCGMGNFTLSLSKKAHYVVGIEGVSSMVEKATRNAERNACDNVKFYQSDLDKPFITQHWAAQPFNKILLDPPRSGAAFALEALCQLQAEKIVYVSCNPATLVRDMEILVNAGYVLRKTAMLDMFPHTGHLESISLFEKQ